MNTGIKLYKEENHGDPRFGYQNVDIARDFAQKAVVHIEELAKKLNKTCVVLGCIDNSSAFLSAFVKQLQPGYVIASGSKYEDKYLRLNGCDDYADDQFLFIFLDDYIYTGEAVKLALELVEKEFTIDHKQFYSIVIKKSWIMDPLPEKVNVIKLCHD